MYMFFLVFTNTIKDNKILKIIIYSCTNFSIFSITSFVLRNFVNVYCARHAGVRTITRLKLQCLGGWMFV
jgi:hypothetical protein